MAKRGRKPAVLPPEIIERYVRGELRSAQAVADAAGLCRRTVEKLLRQAGVLRPQREAASRCAQVQAQASRRKYARRNARMARLRDAGRTLQEIADATGVCNQRVHQILYPER